MLGTRSRFFFARPGNALDTDPSVFMQPRATTRPVANKESVWRPSATTAAPATLGSTDQSVNMVRWLSCGYDCAHRSCAGGDAGEEAVLETPGTKGSPSLPSVRLAHSNCSYTHTCSGLKDFILRENVCLEKSQKAKGECKGSQTKANFTCLMEKPVKE